MATINSHGLILREWEAVLAATEANPELIPLVEEQRATLQGLLEMVRELKAEQKTLTANRQRVTQKLESLLIEGREVVRELRTAAKLKLGLRNEQLVEFGVAPLRLGSSGSRRAVLNNKLAQEVTQEGEEGQRPEPEPSAES